MSHLDSNIRLSLIVDRIAKSPCSFAEIDHYLEEQGHLKQSDFVVSKRTFRRDLNDILSHFNIEVKYNKRENKYFIDQEEAIDTIGNRLIDAMNTVHVLSLSGMEAVMDFQKGAVYRSFYLWDLTEAIKKNLVIHISYSKYWSMHEVSTYQLQPYKLKEFEHRWYLIGKDLRADMIKTFGIDRIKSLSVTKHRFIPDDKSIADKFKDCYGIIDDIAEKPVEIELRFDELQAEYIKSLPLHATQKIIYEHKGGVGVTLSIKITYDFIMKLLSFGNNVEVIRPNKLINRVKKAHLDAYNRYE